MKNRKRIVATAIGALLMVGGVSAKDAWEYHEAAWDATKSYGNVTVAQDSVQQWGPWEAFVEPAAGSPSVGFAGAPNAEYYRPLLNIPAAPTIVTGPFESVGASGVIRGQLTWTTTADLDFHLTVPGGGHVAYYNLSVALPGGAVARLDHDNLGHTIDVAPNLRVENIAITGGTPPVGTYAFYVHSYTPASTGPTTATVRLTGDGGATNRVYTPTLSNRNVSPTYNVIYSGPGVAPGYSP